MIHTRDSIYSLPCNFRNSVSGWPRNTIDFILPVGSGSYAFPIPRNEISFNVSNDDDVMLDNLISSITIVDHDQPFINQNDKSILRANMSKNQKFVLNQALITMSHKFISYTKSALRHSQPFSKSAQTKLEEVNFSMNKNQLDVHKAKKFITKYSFNAQNKFDKNTEYYNYEYKNKNKSLFEFIVSGNVTYYHKDIYHSILSLTCRANPVSNFVWI